MMHRTIGLTDTIGPLTLTQTSSDSPLVRCIVKCDRYFGYLGYCTLYAVGLTYALFAGNFGILTIVDYLRYYDVICVI